MAFFTIDYNSGENTGSAGLVFLLNNDSNQYVVWDGAAYDSVESYNSANLATYIGETTETGNIGRYIGVLPTDLPVGMYSMICFVTADTSTPTEAEVENKFAAPQYYWDGTDLRPALAVHTAAILADTTEMQVDQADGGRLDVIWDAIQTAAERLTAARAQVLTDLINGGRLDAILDELTVQGDTNETKLDAIPTNPMLDTEDGSSLTAIPDMATAANVSTAESNIRGTDNDSLKTLSDQLDTVSEVGGAGAIEETIVCQVSGVPVDGVEVWITTDEAGSNVIAGALSTDASGEATFMLDAGDYWVWRQKGGYNFTNPQALTVD